MSSVSRLVSLRIVLPCLLKLNCRRRLSDALFLSWKLELFFISWLSDLRDKFFAFDRCSRRHCLAVFYYQFTLPWAGKIFWISFVYRKPIFSMALSKRPSMEIHLSLSMVFASKARSFCVDQLTSGSSLINQIWTKLIDHTITNLGSWVQEIKHFIYYALWYLFRTQVVPLDSENLSWTEKDYITLTWAIFVANEYNPVMTDIAVNNVSTWLPSFPTFV